jgi:hypothetical protein
MEYFCRQLSLGPLLASAGFYRWNLAEEELYLVQVGMLEE